MLFLLLFHHSISYHTKRTNNSKEVVTFHQLLHGCYMSTTWHGNNLPRCSVHGGILHVPSREEKASPRTVLTAEGHKPVLSLCESMMKARVGGDLGVSLPCNHRWEGEGAGECLPWWRWWKPWMKKNREKNPECQYTCIYIHIDR